MTVSGYTLLSDCKIILNQILKNLKLNYHQYFEKKISSTQKMFNGAEGFTSLIKCQLCQSILKEAKILPCGLFCNNCITELTKNFDQESKEFTCKPCDETHPIPKNGFKSWKALNEFYSKELNFEEIYRAVQSSPDRETAAAVSLALLTLKNNEQCKVCLEYQIIEKGYSCSKKHFMCWQCFEDHVKQVSGPDSVGKGIDNDGNLLCVECNELITLLNVAKGSVPKNVFDLLEKLKSNSVIKKAVGKALQEQGTQLKKEFDRIMAIQDQDERDAERMRLDIIEDILTLRCPRCKIAFIDYEGCAALICSCCKAGFCAFCLIDCGDNAHSHLPICNQNLNKQTYIALPEFNIRQSKRRQDLINEKIKDFALKAKTLLLKKMSKDLTDLGIAIN